MVREPNEVESNVRIVAFDVIIWAHFLWNELRNNWTELKKNEKNISKYNYSNDANKCRN